MKKIIFLSWMMIFSISSVTFGGKYLCVTKVGSKLSFDGKKTENPKTIVGGKFLIYTFKNNSGLRYVKSINKENSYYICAPEKLMEKNFKIENKIKLATSINDGFKNQIINKLIKIDGHTRIFHSSNLSLDQDDYEYIKKNIIMTIFS